MDSEKTGSSSTKNPKLFVRKIDKMPVPSASDFIDFFLELEFPFRLFSSHSFICKINLMILHLLYVRVLLFAVVRKYSRHAFE